MWVFDVFDYDEITKLVARWSLNYGLRARTYQVWMQGIAESLMSKGIYKHSFPPPLPPHTSTRIAADTVEAVR
eukprot:3573483-Rhodomonas_salina.1